MRISSSVRCSCVLVLATAYNASMAAAATALLSESTPTIHNGNTEQELVTPPLRGLIVKDSESNSIPTPRIIGGQTPNDPNRFPYFALMNGSSQCGAVLISRRFVLTAAHCVGADNDFEIGITERLSFVEAFLADSDSGGTEYPYRNGIVHPDYNDYSVSNDIALYELDRDVPDRIPYIRLARDPNSVATMASGTPMTVIGFGDTDPSNYYDVLSDELLEATVGFVPRGECSARMGPGQIGPDVLCAYNPNGEDSCGGDSGGPLLLKGNSNNPSGNGNGNGNTAAYNGDSDSLVGLVSWGYDCGGDTPGVYTNIAYFYDWIVESMCAMNPSAVPEYVVCSSGSSSSTVAGGSGSGESNELGNSGSTGNSGSGSGSILTPPDTQVPPTVPYDDDDDEYIYYDDDLFQEVSDWFQDAVDWIQNFLE